MTSEETVTWIGIGILAAGAWYYLSDMFTSDWGNDTPDTGTGGGSPSWEPDWDGDGEPGGPLTGGASDGSGVGGDVVDAIDITPFNFASRAARAGVNVGAGIGRTVGGFL